MATYRGWKYKVVEIKHILKEHYLKLKFLPDHADWGKPVGNEPVYIAMVDGRVKHGGLCDRLKSIISLYAYCKYNDLHFRIYYKYPYCLEDYLRPVCYDWKLRSGEYTGNPRYYRILYMRKEHTGRRLFKLNTRRQVHFYGNRDILPLLNKRYGRGGNCFTWGELFHELFIPSPELTESVETVKRTIGGKYSAAVFRFQNLLGDFPEYGFRAIADKESQEKLIATCINALIDIKEKKGIHRLLVTSDSKIFLDRVSSLPEIYVIPGNPVHADVKDILSGNRDYEKHLKSFVDFYALSEADKIYRIGTSGMYPSEFPVYAAKVNDIPFESITV